MLQSSAYRQNRCPLRSSSLSSSSRTMFARSGDRGPLVGLDALPRPHEIAEVGHLLHEVFPVCGFEFPLHGLLRTLSARISAFHFAAFRRQVGPEVKGHLTFRVSFLPLSTHAILLARITYTPARLGCAEPLWTFATGFARRDPAAPPIQSTTSHPTGCRRASLRAPSRLRDGPAPRPRRDRLHELGAGDRDLSGGSQGGIRKKVKFHGFTDEAS